MNSPDLFEQQAQLRLQMHHAFEGVVLGDGTGLGEADVIDDYGTAEERRLARFRDFQGPWWEHPRDRLRMYTSVFCFMDAAGYTYHLAVYLWHALQEDPQQGLGDVGWLVFDLLDFARIQQPQMTASQIQMILKFTEWIEVLEPERMQHEDFRAEVRRVWAHWAEQLEGLSR
ncbi:DUF6714 family protein [Deinococcus cellulosilyticus]|uniref:Uncharacterized protein n=1 Tax=Deinococcus cellulosilyticus (strain DSM 18568 / NBRC 106333 / KACC 11606 / 5516J-15) TaxID=1223518 RepID=A0A511N4A2_DEIC1|nr:DUF6714 family protein [Deinococcus cellulosilyticus]GEM47703.1 hypothetical protein DC3_33380 [Deinococcus cellulosilyticus NBRC 106333 = KACC 11606]